MNKRLLTLTLAIGFARTAHAQMPPGFAPAPAPQSGDTAGCPSVSALAAQQGRFARDGAAGYYLLDAHNKVAPIDPHSIERKLGALENFDPDSTEKLDEADSAMITLWGYRCAYWQDNAIAKLLQTGRELYAKHTGIDPMLEKRFHLLGLDNVMVAKETGSVCAQTWPIAGDPNRSAMAAVLGCASDPKTARGYLWSVGDLGNPSTIFLAAAATQCSRNETYFDWRICQIDAGNVTAESFARDAKAAGMGPYVQARTMRNLELARRRIASQADAMTKLESGYPSDKELVDAVIKQVNEHYLPMFAKWGKQLSELDTWETGLTGGPGNAGDCVPKLTAQLQAYVDSVVPKASADALTDAMKDPIGHRMTHALAMCYAEKGDEMTAKLIESLSVGGDDAGGFHEAVDALLRKNGRGGKYRDVRLSTTDVRLGYYKHVAGSGHGVGVPSHGNDEEAEVASVTTSGESDKVTFVHASKKTAGNPICEVDYRTIVGIDDYGNIRYALKNCQPTTEVVNLTPSPVLIPKASAPAKKGLRAVVHETELHPRDEKHAEPGRVVTLRRGKDLIWAMGITAK